MNTEVSQSSTQLAPNLAIITSPTATAPSIPHVQWQNAPRRKGVTIDRNIVHGSEAWTLTGKKDKTGPPSAADGDEPSLPSNRVACTTPNPNDTHRWRVYLRALNPSDDISHFISEVVFVLHESFANPRVSVKTPPYEVEATGWGEFGINIIVHFIDPTEKPVEFHHPLKLFAPDNSLPRKGRSIISEHHDQIIFVDPSEPLYQILSAYKPHSGPGQLQEWEVINDESSLNKIITTSDRVKDETARLRSLYEASAKEALELRKAIEKLQSEEQMRNIIAAANVSANK